MKHYYAVKDLAVQAFGIPFLVRAKGEALRSFQDEVNKTDGQSAIAQHPDDYELYYIADYDEITGTITPRGGREHPEIELIARAKDLLRSQT